MLEPTFLSKNYSTILIWQSQLIFGPVIIKKKKKKQMVLERVVIRTKKSLLQSYLLIGDLPWCYCSLHESFHFNSSD
jgi:hypothetical protein